ncbi:MAG: hypothetical protein ABIK49_03345 [candidate division WOR-3 bacterium]
MVVVGYPFLMEGDFLLYYGERLFLPVVVRLLTHRGKGVILIMARRAFLTVFILLSILMSRCRRQYSDFFPLVPNAVRIMKVTERTITGKDTTVRSEVRVVEVVKGLKEVPRLGKVWVVETPLQSGSSTIYYYERKGDTVFKLVPGRGGRVERIVYLIQPLSVGRKWFESDEEREETEVVAEEDVSVPAGFFAGCFRVETRSSKVDFHQRLWLASGLGVVKREKEQRWSRGDTYFELFRAEELVEYRILKSKR